LDRIVLLMEGKKGKQICMVCAVVACGVDAFCGRYFRRKLRVEDWNVGNNVGMERNSYSPRAFICTQTTIVARRESVEILCFMLWFILSGSLTFSWNIPIHKCVISLNIASRWMSGSHQAAKVCNYRRWQLYETGVTRRFLFWNMRFDVIMVADMKITSFPFVTTCTFVN
jgi:hypothetical protein